MICKNCKTHLKNDDKFCSNCGAKVIDHRITLKHLFHEAKESFYSLDTNKPLLTFLHLFNKPEEVIGGYINGVRKKYINAFGYFTIAVTLSSFFFFIFLKWYPNLMDFTVERAAMPNVSKEQLELQTQVTKTFFEYSSLMFFLTIPFTALISRIVFLKNKKYNYAEHLIINLYSYSHVSISTTLIYFLTIWNQTIFSIVSLFAIIIQITYYAYVLKRIYQLNAEQIILKTLLFLAILFVFMFVLIVLGIIIGYTTGFFDPIIEAAKAKKEAAYLINTALDWTA